MVGIYTTKNIDKLYLSFIIQVLFILYIPRQITVMYSTKYFSEAKVMKLNNRVIKVNITHNSLG